MAGTGAPERPLRADAVRNRAKILAAAAEVFADRGLDVTLDDIARHAGLGVGTVYRRFADRESLIEALFDERMQVTIAKMQAALQAPDADQALIGVIREVCESFAIDRGLRQVMLSSTHGLERVTECRTQVKALVEQLVARAKATGRLRADFEASDLPILFLMVGSVVDFAGAVQPDLWRRYLNLLLDGLRAPSDAEPHLMVSASALSDDELSAAMHTWRPVTLR